MSETKHTSGPWSEWRFDTQADIAVGPTEGGLAVAEIVTVNANGIRTQESFDIGKANARLIAAAPELLAICEELLEAAETTLEMGSYYEPTIKEAYDIIAKAKGENDR